MANLESGCAVIFPGQGAQIVGMCDVWARHPLGRAVLNEASEITGFDIVAQSHYESQLQRTEFVQPAIVACEIAALSVLEDNPAFRFDAAAGHSLGEFSALVAAGVMTLSDVLGIVGIRAAAMQEAGDRRPGTMSALLRISAETAAAMCQEVDGGDILLVANENSSDQVVISGAVPAVERAEALAATRRIRAIRLNVAGAYHSPLMNPAVEPIAAALSAVEFQRPLVPIAENVSGRLVTDTDELRRLLERHVVSPVKWESCIKSLGAHGITRFIEAGPGNTLTKLVKRILPSASAEAVNSPATAMQFSGLVAPARSQ